MNRRLRVSASFFPTAAVLLLPFIIIFSFCVSVSAQPGEEGFYLARAAAELKRLDDQILKTPDDPELYFRRGQIYLNWFNTHPSVVEHQGTVYATDPGGKALSDFERAIGLKPSGPYFVVLGKYFQAVHGHREREMGDVTATTPWREILKRYWQDELFDSVVENFQKGVERGRDNKERAYALANLGNFYHSRASRASTGSLAKIVRREKQTALVYEDWDRAIDLEKRTRDIYGQNGLGLAGLRDLFREKAMAAVEFGDPALGIQILDDGIEAIADRGGKRELACYLYVRRGELNTMRRDISAAVKDYTKAIEGKMVNCLDVFERRGDAFAALGEWESAVKDYTREMALFQHRVARLHAKRGNAYLKTGEGEKALADLDEAIEFSVCGPLYALRAQALRLLNKIDLAERDDAKSAEYSRGRRNDQCAFR